MQGFSTILNWNPRRVGVIYASTYNFIARGQFSLVVKYQVWSLFNWFNPCLKFRYVTRFYYILPNCLSYEMDDNIDFAKNDSDTSIKVAKMYFCVLGPIIQRITDLLETLFCIKSIVCHWYDSSLGIYLIWTVGMYVVYLFFYRSSKQRCHTLSYHARKLTLR